MAPPHQPGLIDTNVLIDLHRRNPAAITFTTPLIAAGPPDISDVTVMELIQGCRNRKELADLQLLLADFHAHPLTPSISAAAIDLMKSFALSHGRQDAAGRVWVALSRKRGLQYEASEVGEPIARYCDLMSLRVVSTLAELLERFEMLRTDGGSPGEPIRIAATIRPSFLNRNPRFREVALTLDPVTKMLWKAVLKRQANGEPVGTLTFELAGQAPQPDDRYQLRGHLDPDAEVLDGTDRRWFDRRNRFRDEFLKRVQGRLK